MKFTLATIVLLVGLAVGAPAGNGQLSSSQDASDATTAAGNKANSNVNVAANDGSTGVKAADTAEAAILLNDNGDAGAASSGAAFDAAVQAIKNSGNQDEIDVLTGAGIDVNAAGN
ncbi:hypothetical protein M406DRAFT_332606 [Cryphonectria parasitica EP155]|uniref:Uncharacterized protein n=1 Tax=Cryphonectria parasitica (strain ATCC 38755 / EP155) TaxID=660469 RepID=A0A9P4XWN5_CRYP1|nr:uncharacterized protein M406DRAFT_332606 [Cryphonectria parasitica EP155]KAF3762221.1 hypothetical protein M406DRAFT_332606 [Cryphonectria parasitica EP155]